MDVDYFCRSQSQEVHSLVLEQARSLRTSRYSQAQKLGLTIFLMSLAKNLGEPIEGCREFRHGEISCIWHEEESGRGYAIAKIGDQAVFCSRFGDRFIIPGAWLQALLKYKPEVEERISILNQARQQRINLEKCSGVRAQGSRGCVQAGDRGAGVGVPATVHLAGISIFHSKEGGLRVTPKGSENY